MDDVTACFSTPPAPSCKIVLAISQHIGVSEITAPERDFDRLSRMLNAKAVGNGGWHRLPLMVPFEKWTALDIGQALGILRAFPAVDAYVSFSERVGIPLALLLRYKRHRPAHTIIAHHLNSRAKRLLGLVAGWHRGVDRIITLCSAQQKHAERLLPGATAFLRQGIDHRFYRPSDAGEEDYVLSVGNEQRDYTTLITAVSEIGLKLKILSSSPWCRQSQVALKRLSNRVEFLPRVDYGTLRELYQRARAVVVPLYDVDYAAGLNGVLEGFCMSKPIIVSSSRGIEDYISHLYNAYAVPVGDVARMMEALRTVHADRRLREDLKSGARRAVEEFANLDSYTRDLKLEIRTATERHVAET